MNNKNIYLVAISVLISLLLNWLLIPSTPKIVVIDQDEIFKSMVVKVNEVTSKDNEQEMMNELVKYRKVRETLDIEMAKIAKEKNFIILPKSNVIGGEDLTDQAKSLLADLIEEKRTER